MADEKKDEKGNFFTRMPMWVKIGAWFIPLIGGIEMIPGAFDWTVGFIRGTANLPAMYRQFEENQGSPATTYEIECIKEEMDYWHSEEGEVPSNIIEDCVEYKQEDEN